jgi:nitroimidazol reductase NimA-like FMN-containing flavoprotein (pyridoxamine 5'-phosphate oxidase superfamily)
MQKQNHHDIQQDIKDLLASQKLAVLSTQGEKGPYVSLVAFTASDDLKSILFATPIYTRKYDNLKRKPEVALLVDNRSNSADDFKKGRAVTILGTTEELDGEEKKSALDMYSGAHPHLADFARSPTSGLFRIRVQHYYLVREFQNVTELSVD